MRQGYRSRWLSGTRRGRAAVERQELPKDDDPRASTSSLRCCKPQAMLVFGEIQGSSSIGRAPVSKTVTRPSQLRQARNFPTFVLVLKHQKQHSQHNCHNLCQYIGALLFS